MTLKPCPFCGDTEPVVEQYGTSRVSSIVACSNCGCRLESNERTEDTGERWNDRPLDRAEGILTAANERWGKLYAWATDEDWSATRKMMSMLDPTSETWLDQQEGR